MNVNRAKATNEPSADKSKTTNKPELSHFYIDQRNIPDNLDDANFIHATGTFYVFARDEEWYTHLVQKACDNAQRDIDDESMDDEAVFGISAKMLYERFGDNLIIATGGQKFNDMSGWTILPDGKAFPYGVSMLRKADIVIATKDRTSFGDASILIDFIGRYFERAAQAGGAFVMQISIDDARAIHLENSAVETCEETPEHQTWRRTQAIIDRDESLSEFFEILRNHF